MEFNIQFKTISVFKILEIIDPKIKSNYDLETKYKIIQGLKEIDLKVYNYVLLIILLQNLGLTIPDEYSELLTRSEEITKSYSLRRINLKYLKSIVENLMRNVSKIRNISNLQMKIKELENIFEDYTYEKLLELFKDLKNI